MNYFIVILILIGISIVIVKEIEMEKRIKPYLPIFQGGLLERMIKRQKYKKVLREFDQSFTSNYNYMLYSHRDIFKCQYLMEGTRAPELEEKYQLDKRYYDQEGLNIEKGALKRIHLCLEKKYAGESGILYFKKHINFAMRTISIIDQRSVKYKKYFPSLYNQRMTYLNQLKQHCEKSVNELERRVADYNNAIRELEKIKKPTGWERVKKVATNVVTAPFRHTYNIVDGLVKRDKKKVIVGGSLLGIAFLGGSFIGDAIESLDFIGGSEFSDYDHLTNEVGEGEHFVQPHEVDGYYREDGTYVDGYYRDGDGDTSVNLTAEEGGGYYRSNPRS
ncbi:hypothetical protein [Salipaludibacillus daqingensis]|uniref:hypothetical protein n=1 Tax=Salipaludibacillus daqingensis TaxID=3041001 RepID=UPI002474EC38|nr:hypothetical protein [Salipaludibacillus daqingensis]